MSKVPSLQYDQDIEGVFVEPEGLNIDEETGEVLESE